MSKLILNKEQLTNLIETVVKDVLKKGPVYKKWTSISPEKREKIVNTSKILLEQEQEDDRDPVVRSYSTDDPTLQSKANSYYSIPQGGSWTIGRGGQPRGNDIVTVDEETTKQQLSYEKFVVPLVKAVQELSAELEELKKKVK